MNSNSFVQVWIQVADYIYFDYNHFTESHTRPKDITDNAI